MDQKVVFSGRVREGMSVDQVRANFAQMFKLSDPAVLDRMFSGQPVVLRKNLSADQAGQFMRVLFKAGAMCEVKAAAPPAPAAPASVPGTGEFRAADLAATVPSGLRVRLDGPAAPPAVPAPAPAAVPPSALSGLSLIADPAPAPTPSGSAARVHAQPGRATAEGLAMMTEPPDAARRAPEVEPEEEHGGDAHGYTKIPDDPLLQRWQPDSDLPKMAEGLAWGGFFAPLIWGAFNGMALSALPLIGVRVLRNVVPAWVWLILYLAFGTFFLFKGRELAWARKNWRDVGHFLRVQKYWNYGGAVLFVLFMWGIGQLIRQEKLDEQFAVAVEALIVAEQQADPDRRTSMVAQARKDLLALIEDPLERAEVQKEFDDQDAAAAEEAAWEAEMAEFPVE